MKKNFAKVLLAVFILFAFGTNSIYKVEAKGKKGISKAEIVTIGTSLDNLTKKIYAVELFSPEDNEQLVDIKIKLENALLSGANPEFAPLIYKTAIIYKSRGKKDEATDLFQAILENYGDTALAPKAQRELGKMGVKIQLPGTPVIK